MKQSHTNVFLRCGEVVSLLTSISANADGPRNAASRKIANTTLHANLNHQAATLQAIFKAHCNTDRHLSVISTFIHGKAQTPLGRYVVDGSNVCNKYTRNRTDGA